MFLVALAFIGDSDIARWPEHLLPSLSLPNLSHHELTVTIFQNAVGGSTMKNLPTQIRGIQESISADENNFDATIYIACCGENDVSNKIPIHLIMESFQKAVKAIFHPKESSTPDCHSQPHLIFLGPKVEPWMGSDEIEARKGYFQLSEQLNAEITKLCATVADEHKDHAHSLEHTDCVEDGHSIIFLNCLTMFCEEATKVLSVVGGGAIADKKFFNEDTLHLSDEGYMLWKEEVEIILAKLICNEECIQSLDNSHGLNIVL